MVEAKNEPDVGKQREAPNTPEEFDKDKFDAYENGKYRRYNLLFAVNGGAFAVAKHFGEQTSEQVLGSLSLEQLSYGMILFTIVMTADIFAFGWRMRKDHLKSAFTPFGQAVLLIIGTLISAGWYLVACPAA